MFCCKNRGIVTCMSFMVRLNDKLHFSFAIFLFRLQNELQTYLGLRKKDKVSCLTTLLIYVVWYYRKLFAGL